MGISINEARENNIITSECYEIIPKKCKCNSELIFNESLKWLECTSKSCKYKLVNSIISISNRIGLNLSEADIIKIIDRLGIISPYQLLTLNESIEKYINNININYSILSDYRNTPHFIYEIAEICGDKTIENVAKSIFFGFNSFDEAYSEIETSQVSFIDERLGIANTDSMALSYYIYNTLVDLKEQFIFIESQITIKKHNNRLRIAFSDNTLPFINKTEAIMYLNDKYEYTFCTVSSINEHTDIVIKNSEYNSNKYRIASSINNKYVADLMNNDKITLSEINKLQDDKLKPVGSLVYVTTIEGLIKHLDTLKGTLNNEWYKI